jgi:hypothetical protein
LGNTSVWIVTGLSVAYTIVSTIYFLGFIDGFYAEEKIENEFPFYHIILVFGLTLYLSFLMILRNLIPKYDKENSPKNEGD